MTSVQLPRASRGLPVVTIVACMDMPLSLAEQRTIHQAAVGLPATRLLCCPAPYMPSIAAQQVLWAPVAACRVVPAYPVLLRLIRPPCISLALQIPVFGHPAPRCSRSPRPLARSRSSLRLNPSHLVTALDPIRPLQRSWPVKAKINTSVVGEVAQVFVRHTGRVHCCLRRHFFAPGAWRHNLGAVM